MNIYHALFAIGVLSFVTLAAYATAQYSPSMTLSTSLSYVRVSTTVTKSYTTTISGTPTTNTLLTTSILTMPASTVSTNTTLTVTSNNTIYSTETSTRTHYSTETMISNVTQVTTSYVAIVQTVATSVGDSNYGDCQYSTCLLNMAVSSPSGSLTPIASSDGQIIKVTGGADLSINASAWIVDSQDSYNGYIPIYNLPLNLSYLAQSGVSASSDVVTGQNGITFAKYTVPCGFVGKQFTLVLTPTVQGNYHTSGSGTLPELTLQIVPGGC